MAAGLLLVMAAGAQAQPKTKGKDEAYDAAVARHVLDPDRCFQDG